jgi:hypothetical protein
MSLLLDTLDNVADLEGGAELDAHVLHHQLGVQEQEGFTVNFLRERRISNNAMRDRSAETTTL